jgi:molecular chaperone DnaJ
MPSKDYYALLGVPRSASPEDIKKAFRALALRYHPDRQPDDIDADRRFKEILEAYETLADPERRRQYDQLGPLFTPSGRLPSPDELNGILRETLGGLFRRRKAGRRGRDLEAQVEVSLEEVLSGVERTLELARQVRCRRCGGGGADPDGGSRVCADCEGTGRSRGRTLLRASCPRCDGTGRIVTRRCSRCGGEGRHGSVETLKVRVPPGVGPGQRLKLKDKGDAGDPGEPDGDLLVAVRFRTHPLFQRRGCDLLCELPLTFPEMVLGTTLRVPTLSGEASLRIPAGTPPARVFRLPREGLPSISGGERGSVLYKVALELPPSIHPEARSILERFATLHPPRSHARRGPFEDSLPQCTARLRPEERP